MINLRLYQLPRKTISPSALFWFQVMNSVLNFFLVYCFHFMGYAIAFHVLLPHTEDFKHVGDGTLKVPVMHTVTVLSKCLLFRVAFNSYLFSKRYLL